MEGLLSQLQTLNFACAERNANEQKPFFEVIRFELIWHMDI